MAGMDVVNETAEARLDGFISRYSPQIQELARDSLAKMQARLPAANQLVYDNYNALVVGFCPNLRTSDAIFSIALYPRSVNLFFLQGAGLPDANALLRGSGSVARHVVVEDTDYLDRPEIQELIDRALDSARVPMPEAGSGNLIIKSVSEKQRPRVSVR